MQNCTQVLQQLFKMQSSATVSSVTREKGYCPNITGSFFQEGRQKEGTRPYAINVRCEWNCSLLSAFYCWRSFSSTVSHLLSLLQSLTLLACSLDASQPLYASCCTVLLYFPRLKMFFCCSFIFCVLILFVWECYKPLTVEYCVPDWVGCAPRLTLDLTCSWNATCMYVCRGLSISVIVSLM